jgi:ABC-2 type transport system ATP-binding protein
VTPMIEVDRLVRRFGPRVAVDDVSFAVAPGEVFGLLGPNGAGKTTTLRVVLTLLAPTSGTVRVAGLDVRRHGAAVRRWLGYVPQQLSVDGTLTARENLLLIAKLLGLPAAERSRRITRLLEQLRLAEVADQVVRTYSGGMVRRLEIGQAMLHQPRVLVLDEPTVGLDPTARHQIWHLLDELRAETGMTVLLTTHYMEEAEQVCQRLAILHRGRVVALGTPAELKERSGRPDARLEEVFTAVTGEDWESGGTFYDLRQLGRRRRQG